MKEINFSNLGDKLNKDELNETRGGLADSCECSNWVNGLTRDYYHSTCGCSGMGSVFADLIK